MEKKYIGVTLLFIDTKSKKGCTACLKSYIVRVESSWFSLVEEVERIIGHKSNSGAVFFGIEDVYYVSGKFKEYCVVGKTYYEELNTERLAKKLLLDVKHYSVKKVSRNTQGWMMASLVYYCSDLKGIPFTITCLTPIRARKYSDVNKKISIIANKRTFKNRIVTPLIDKFDGTKLEFIGVQNISYLPENPSKGEAFQCFYKDTNDLKEIVEILRDRKEVKKKFSFTIDRI